MERGRTERRREEGRVGEKTEEDGAQDLGRESEQRAAWGGDSGRRGAESRGRHSGLFIRIPSAYVKSSGNRGSWLVKWAATGLLAVSCCCLFSSATPASTRRTLGLQKTRWPNSVSGTQCQLMDKVLWQHCFGPWAPAAFPRSLVYVTPGSIHS